MVLEAGADETCLAELALIRQTADHDGDFAQVVLAGGNCEVVRAATGEGAARVAPEDASGPSAAGKR